MANTQRLDQLLVERQLAPSRNKAQALILAGQVRVNGETIDKASKTVSPDVEIVIDEGLPYVSRAGLKLASALETFGADVFDPQGASELVALDIGASTGGFTDCLLQRGFRKVYAVDVGYNQLAYKLRQDERVVVMERTNIRHLEADDLDERVDLIVIDVSFISIRKFLDRLSLFLKPGGKVLAMVKPQFEAERGEVGKGGIIRDETLRQAIVRRFVEAAETNGFQCFGSVDSALTGAKGNREVFCLLRLAH